MTASTVRFSRPSTLLLVRRGAIAGVAAAIVTTATAAIARSADVALEVDGAAIPVAAFAMWTLVGAALGVALARVLGNRRRFVAVTVAATVLSLIPPLALPDEGSSTLVLVAAHLLAAAIVIPALGRLLPTALDG
jgi:L-alanine-DL-glutamate epimerase-like enolase superfamily enzyme